MLLYLGNKLLSKDRNASGIDTLSTLLKIEGHVIRSVSSYRLKPLRLLSMVLNLIWYSRKINYVLIDTYSTNNFYYAYIISKLSSYLKLKYIPILRGGNLPTRLDTSPRMAKAIFNNSYKNIAPSNYLKSEFKKRGFEVTFIPNIIEIDNYKFNERGISTPKLLYVRAFASIYNPEMAIYVLDKLLKTHSDASLCMVGPIKDDSFERCKTLAKELKIEDHVEFTGKLSKEQWHKKAAHFNVFINTTNIDNTPVSVMEAMALGLPVVSTNVGGVPYLIKENETGLLVDKGNVEQMAKAIMKILNDSDLKSKLVKNARNQVEKFDWKAVRQLWSDILQ